MAPAARVTIAVPVMGDAEMLGGCASTYMLKSWPNTRLVDGELRVFNAWTNPEPEQVQRWWKGEQQSISQHAEHVQKDMSDGAASCRGSSLV